MIPKTWIIVDHHKSRGISDNELPAGHDAIGLEKEAPDLRKRSR